MPIFEYRCGECRRKFEKIVLNVAAATKAELPVCPRCGAAGAEKLVSRFATASKGGDDDFGDDFGAGGGMDEGDSDEPGGYGEDDGWGGGAGDDGEDGEDDDGGNADADDGGGEEDD